MQNPIALMDKEKVPSRLLGTGLAEFAPLIDRNCSQNSLYKYITIGKLMI